MTPVAEKIATKLTIANAVWIATALLQREFPEAVFTTEKIVERVKLEKLSSSQDHIIAQHVRQHCVANRAAQPNTLRMLSAWGRGERTLFRQGDKEHADRKEGRLRPEIEDMPESYRYLIDWFDHEWYPRYKLTDTDPLIALRGTGKNFWKMDAVVYTDQLREDAR